MLVLTCRPSEAVIIGGHVTVRVAGVRGRRVRLAFEAAPEIPIVRAELVARTRAVPRAASSEPRRVA